MVMSLAEINKEELMRLSPEERIRRLRQLEEERKKEIEDAQKLIRESEGQIERDRSLEDVEVPEAPSVDISKLFGAEEKETLEGAVEEAPQPEMEGEHLRYQVQQDYEALKELQEGMINNTVNPYDAANQVNEIEERLNTINYQQAKQESKEVADQLVASRNVIQMIKKYGGIE